ncbi:MAG: hypothetical protein RBS08_03540 [Bdellovibrionales bacterium]|jgi:hypothetical protein|nr:hypothetical protein [Bdellovibrionales bacterium]
MSQPKSPQPKSRRLVVICAIGALALLALGGGMLLKNVLPSQAKTEAERQAMARNIAIVHKAFYTRLDDRAKTHTAADVSTYIHASIQNDPALLAVALDWARDNSAGQGDLQNLNPFYFMVYTDLAYLGAQAFEMQGMRAEYEDLSKAAFASLLTFDVLTATDALRCADKTVRDLRTTLVAPRYQLLDYVFDIMSPEQMDELFITILRTESAMGLRAENRELCAGGAEGKLALLQHPDAKRTEIDVPETPGAKRTILVPPENFKFQPSYISLDDWLALREPMQNAVRDSWFQRQVNHTNQKAAELIGEYIKENPEALNSAAPDAVPAEKSQTEKPAPKKQ